MSAYTLLSGGFADRMDNLIMALTNGVRCEKNSYKELNVLHKLYFVYYIHVYIVWMFYTVYNNIIVWKSKKNPWVQQYYSCEWKLNAMKGKSVFLSAKIWLQTSIKSLIPRHTRSMHEKIICIVFILFVTTE